MTALPPVPKCIEFVIFFNDDGNDNVRMILHFTYSNTLAQTDLQTLCNNMLSDYITHMGPQTYTGTTIQGVTGNDLSSDLSPKSASTLAGAAGTATGGRLSSGAAFVIGHETARKYKGGHSRTYVPGIVESNLQDGNTWTAAAQTAILTAWNAFITSFIQTAVPVAVGVLTQAVAHRYGASAAAPVSGTATASKSVPLTSPFTDPVTASVANPQVGSQRRRNQQGG